MLENNPIQTLSPHVFPSLLCEIADPPKKLFIRGNLPPADHKYLCIVGSRKYSSYGKEACEKLVAGLAGYPIVIVSGLALGIDTIAHQTALTHNLLTIAIPGSGLNDAVLYPRSNLNLAHTIIKKGGALISEYEPDFQATQWSFPQRNRIMAGMSDAVLIIEAHEQSGTLITARLTADYNRDLLVVPSSIFSQSGQGSNNLLREGGIAVTKPEHILEALHINVTEDKKHNRALYENLSEDERRIVELLSHEPLEKDELIRQIALPTHKANILISALEIKGIIIERLGKLESTP